MRRSKLAFFLFVFTFSTLGFTQNRSFYPQQWGPRQERFWLAGVERDRLPVQPLYFNDQTLEQQYGASYWNGQGAGPAVLSDRARGAAAQAQYEDVEERRRLREAAELLEIQAHANPEAPDQSELLKNSRDPDFILRNFRTMYVDARNAHYFGSDQMKAALGKNKEFQKLGIHIVDDPRVADVVLKVGYTFAWDYPFELRHQNTTIVLLAGKGEGPFSGPLGAADVARQFVKAARRWREEKKSP